MDRIFSFIVRTRGLPIPLRFLLAGLLVGAAFATRSLFDLPGHVFVFFIAPVVLAAALFDWGAGLLATVLGAGLTKLYWLEPDANFVAQNAETQLALGAFLLTGMLISGLLEIYYRLLVRLQHKSAKLTEALTMSTELTRQNQILALETNHRIRNHLQIMAAILSQQARQPGVTREDAFQLALEQIQSMARVQGALEARNNRNVISLREFLTSLCDELHRSIAQPQGIELRCRADDLRVTVRVASTIGLLVSEMVTKAVKYALHAQVRGLLDIDVTVTDSDCMLDIRDIGIGFDRELAIGVGQWLIETLAAQLGGRITGLDPEGASMRVSMPRAAIEKPVAAAEAPAASPAAEPLRTSVK
jgi:two-component sensor histidine kinase